LGAIRLAWWREALERLDSGPAPAEPRLQAVSQALLPRGITGASLAQLEDGWATLLEESPDLDRIADRGAKLFSIGAGLLGKTDTLIEPAGRLYAREVVRRKQLSALPHPAEEMRLLAGHRFPRGLRPLTALARLAARDINQAPRIEPEATPARAATLISHRLFGTVTQAD
jgi:phytoene synthase